MLCAVWIESSVTMRYVLHNVGERNVSRLKPLYEQGGHSNMQTEHKDSDRTTFCRILQLALHKVLAAVSNNGFQHGDKWNELLLRIFEEGYVKIRTGDEVTISRSTDSEQINSVPSAVAVNLAYQTGKSQTDSFVTRRQVRKKSKEREKGWNEGHNK